MRRLFRNRLFLSALGLIAVGVIIWFAGPLIAIGGTVPLKSEMVRLLVIIVIVALWGLNNLRLQAQVNRANKHLITAPSAATPVAPSNSMSQEEIAAVGERFQEALQILKQNNRKKGGNGIYDLPWYIIIGPPGSGKTTALINSGLKFPLAERFGKEALRGVGGTRNCDWWFTEDAVLVDTAGRYTTQDSQADADASAWQGFLEMLKKYRKRRPINGALVAISLSDLLTQNEQQRAQHAHAIKQRLLELRQHLGIRFPVYVLFTKADLIAGFTEYFDDLGADERGQVWGVTLPYSDATPNGVDVSLVDGELDQLFTRISQRAMARINAERDPARRAKIFGFPQQLASLKTLTRDFIDEVFSQSRFDEPPLLRGLYLTSGTQEGTPIDRILSAVSRNFGLQPAQAAGRSGSGRSYFLTRLLRDVVFPEAELVSTNRKFEIQRRWLQYGAYAGAVLLTILAVLAWSTSFTRNQIFVGKFEESLAEYQKEAKKFAPQNADFEQILPRLNALREVTQVYNLRDFAPMLSGLGLNKGKDLAQSSVDAYHRELNRLLAPAIVQRLEKQLVAGGNDPDFLYEALKTYLMLGQKDHFDEQQINLWMGLDWAIMFRDQPDTHGQLQNHLTALIEGGFEPQALNARLISSARNNLQRFPLAQLRYGRMKGDYEAQGNPPFRVTDAAGPGADVVFVRKSGKPLEEGVSAFYSHQAYNDYVEPQLENIAEISSDENWVLSAEQSELTKPEVEALQRDMLTLYLNDYIREWDSFLDDINIVQFSNMRHASEVLEAISSPFSPIRGLLQGVAKNTQLVEPSLLDSSAAKQAAQSGAGGTLARLLQKGVDQVRSQDVKPAQRVNNHFAGIADLLEVNQGGMMPLDRVLQLLQEMYEQVDAMSRGMGDDALKVASGAASTDAARGLQLEASRQPKPVSGWLQQIAGKSRSVAMGGARAQINAAWRADVLPTCQKALAGHYPIDRDAEDEITLTDFGRLFAPGGMIDAFFQENLAPFVKESGGRWSWRPVDGVSLGMSTNVLMQFKRAAQIRDTFFMSGGSKPSVNFQLKPNYLDAYVRGFRLTLDGQQFRYRHGPTRLMPARWPGDEPQARIEFEDSSGVLLSDSTEGPWAWFRMLDNAELQALSDDRIQATFIKKGRKTTWEIRADSVLNPFMMEALKNFRCPQSL